MRTLDELINLSEPAWDFVHQWIKEASNQVEILQVENARANEALYKTQVTTRSPMGAIIFMTGGLIIDQGWIRILGSGHPRLTRSLPDWNKGKTFNEFGETPGFLLIADDAAGGFFILNGGALGEDPGKVWYLSPDTIQFEPMGLTYSEFLNFCFHHNLDEFYSGLRWKNWREDAAGLHGDSTFTFFPFLFTEQGSAIDSVSRRIIPVEEQYLLHLEMRKQFGMEP